MPAPSCAPVRPTSERDPSRSGPAAEQGLDADLQVGSGEQGLYGDRLELLGDGQHLGIEPAQLADRRLILLDGGALGRGEPGHGVPSVGLVLEQHEIVGLVLVHPDDPGHSGVIEPARLGQGRLQQAELSGSDLDTLADVLGEPANLADGIPLLLTLAAPAERRARRPGAGGIARPGPAALLTVTFRSSATSALERTPRCGTARYRLQHRRPRLRAHWPAGS
jgi:hypothetical protein